ncbi:hypothetical protein [Rhodoplanes sp. SY1]|uniref:hypothetical protein n=1 Tax=Rhodoplanes sp. SY1 TaxID=3166646 RepID=UPI0038B4A945
MMTTRTIALALCLAPTLAFTAQAAGALQGAWRTDGGWLTELRTHPDGAKVCSTGKAGETPHGFGFTVVRSGDETIVMVVDQTAPPASAPAAEPVVLAFDQGGRVVGKIPARVTGPAVASADPRAPEASRLLRALIPGPVTITAGDRRWTLDLAGLPTALAELDRCLERAK